jgi:M6 family metalloprotease-like protein
LSKGYRNRAIIVMVLLQFTLSITALSILSPVTLAPSTAVSEQRIIVLPVYSDDTIPTTSIGEIQDRMQNVAQYFDECSYSQMSISSSVVGWIRLDASMDSYADPWSIGDVEHGGVKDEIFMEAISKIDAELDFSQYDRLLIVHAGESGQGSDGNYTKIGTCHTEGWFATTDGRVFLAASIVSEYDEYGTIAHELGHDFGAPDLYDYYSEHPAWTGIGPWGIMSSGNYNGDPSGTLPSHMCVYNKYLIGWIKDREIFVLQNKSLTIDLVPLSLQTEGYRAVKYDLDNGLYYLVEARTNIGYDAGLPRSGVLVMLVNESRIAELRDGVQLQVPIYAGGMYDAALREGEIFYDSESGFSVRVAEFRDDIVSIDVSTNPVEEWAVSERIRFTEGLDVRDVYITTTVDDLFVGDTAFAAVVLERDYESSIQVYSSTNNGRDWEFMFNTNETEYHLYTWDLSFNYYQGLVMLTGRLSGPENTFSGILGYSVNSKSFTVINFTSMVNHSLYEATAVASPDSYYACFTSRMNGTSGITYFRLSDAGWSLTFRPVPEILEIQISNVPHLGEAPFVFYRDGNRHLRLVRFNDTSIIHNITAEYDGVWNIDIICSRDSMVLSYIDAPENETFDVYTIETGSVSQGFSEVIAVNRSEYLRPVLLSYNNLTNTFCSVLSISGDLMYFEITGSNVSNRSLDIEGASSYCALPRVEYSSSQLFLIRIRVGYETYSLASLTWIYGPTDSQSAMAYYQETTAGYVLPVFFIPFTVLGAIVILYFILNSNWAAKKLHERSLQKKARRLRTSFSSIYMEKAVRLQPFFLNILLLGFNIILAVMIFHLVMQLPLVGSGLSHILHDFRSISLSDPGPLVISVIVLAAFLIYLVELEKPAFYVKIIIWLIALVLVGYTRTGWNVGWFIAILTVSLWIPVWFLTSLEIKHTRWNQLYNAAKDSLSSIDTSEEDDEILSLFMDTLEHLKNKGIMHLDEALTDEVLFSKDIPAIACSLYDSLQEQSDDDGVLMKIKSKLDDYRQKDEGPS